MASDLFDNEAIAKPFYDVILDIEDTMLQEFVKKASTNKNIVSFNVWAEKSRELYFNVKNVIDKESQKGLKKIVKLTGKMSEGIATKTVQTIDNFYTSVGKSLKYNVDPSILKRRIFAIQTNLIEKFIVQNSLIQTQAGAKYLNFISGVLSERSLGLNLGDAINKISNKLINDGITNINYAGGTKKTTKSYTEMLVKTTSREIETQSTLSRMDEYDEDLVIASQHSDSSNLCAPYQGKIMSLTGKSKKYKLTLDEAKAGGFFHPNCKHYVSPYIEKFTRKEKPLVSNAERKKRYEALQKQRYLERQLRQNKLKLQSINDNKALTSLQQNSLASKQRQKITIYNKEMKTLLNQNDELRRKRGREVIT